MQTKKHSFIESLANVVVGLVVSLLANYLIFPLFGLSISMTDNLCLGFIYTAISIVRSYCLRRWFNRRAGTVIGGLL